MLAQSLLASVAEGAEAQLSFCTLYALEQDGHGVGRTLDAEI